MLKTLLTVTSMNYKEDISKKSPLLKMISSLLLILGLLFMAILLSRSWKEIQHVLKETNPGLFALSLLCAFIGNAILAIFFRNSLGKYGCEISRSLTNRIFFYGQIAKYIPGKIWSIVFQRSFLKNEGSTGAILFSNIDLLIISITINATIALCLIFFKSSFVFVLLIYVIGVFICLIISKSRYMYVIARFILIKLKQSERKPPLHQDIHGNIFLVISYCAIWFLYLTAWFLVLSASFNLSTREASLYIAFLGLSWIVGILTFLVPAGLGVREGVFIALAKSAGIEASLETLATIAVITRLWLILQELGGAGIIFLSNLNNSASSRNNFLS
jgi:glycosyltransferase 2 family protein